MYIYIQYTSMLIYAYICINVYIHIHILTHETLPVYLRRRTTARCADSASRSSQYRYICLYIDVSLCVYLYGYNTLKPMPISLRRRT